MSFSADVLRARAECEHGCHVIRRPRIAPGALVCVECVKVSEGKARGWRACLAGGVHGAPFEVVVLCPDCVEREQLDA